MKIKTSKTGLIITISLLFITWFVTIWLSYYLANPQDRTETFGFTLTFMCALEFLSFGHIALLFIPNFSRLISWALYPATGVILWIYIALSSVIIIGYNIFSSFFSPKAYFTTLTIETLFFLIILGSIIILNKFKKVEGINMNERKKILANLPEKVQEIYQSVVKNKAYLDTHVYKDIESDIKKLNERFQYCTPFDNRCLDLSVIEIEEKIETNIILLDKIMVNISSNEKERIKDEGTNIQRLTLETLQFLARREKILIK